MNDTRQDPNGADKLSRRKALSRLGGFAALAYTVPAVTMLSAARASDGASSSASAASAASEPSAATGSSVASDPSVASKPSHASQASTATGPSKAEAAFKACGEKNLDDPNYVQCLIDNGL